MTEALIKTLCICWLILLVTTISGVLILLAPVEFWIALGLVVGGILAIVITVFAAEKVFGSP